MRNLVLTGFMAVGKTTVGRIVARQLGRPFVDMDTEIARRAGKSISHIFDVDGEAAFRRLEAAVCAELAGREGWVIATGGGALMDADNRACLMDSNTVVCLTATPKAVLQRVQSDLNDNGVKRPLLAIPDPQAEIARLWDARREMYASVPWQVDTSDRSVEEVAAEVARLADVVTISVQHSEGVYPYHIGEGILKYIGGVLRSAGAPTGSRVAVVSNPVVAPLYVGEVEASLQRSGFYPVICTVPDGEAYKTLETVRSLYDQFLAGGLDRSSTVIAVGGGVTGDLAGFAAATFMRGVRFAQVPTSLLAMVDAAIGGKTGVDLPQGKNLVGAFWQPASVLADSTVLKTLPVEEWRSGMAEMLKHGVIGDAALFSALATGRYPSSREIEQAVRVKVSVVAKDPSETGRRMVLNLGHTVGHALERLSRYSLRHGEAVGIGMLAAARIAAAVGLADSSLSGQIEAALDACGLPYRCPPFPVEAIWEAMTHDKKRQGDTLRWVLPHAIGEVAIVEEVPPKVVRSVLAEIGGVDEGV